MPTMRPPKRGVSISQAVAQAYASNPEESVLIYTLEFRHPVIVDSEGNQIGRRIVNDHADMTAGLELTAPLNPGEMVLFEHCPFSMKPPKEGDGGQVPELVITVGNVNHILMPYLEAQKGSRVPIDITMRPYEANDLTAPHMDPPLSLKAKSFTADMTSVTIRAGYMALTNRRFPAVEYTAKNFNNLVVR